MSSLVGEGAGEGGWGAFRCFFWRVGRFLKQIQVVYTPWPVHMCRRLLKQLPLPPCCSSPEWLWLKVLHYLTQQGRIPATQATPGSGPRPRLRPRVSQSSGQAAPQE